ncbi:unnamed protein product, partial [Polarella glacialis]
ASGEPGSRWEEGWRSWIPIPLSWTAGDQGAAVSQNSEQVVPEELDASTQSASSSSSHSVDVDEGSLITGTQAKEFLLQEDLAAVREQLSAATERCAEAEALRERLHGELEAFEAAWKARLREMQNSEAALIEESSTNLVRRMGVQLQQNLRQVREQAFQLKSERSIKAATARTALLCGHQKLGKSLTESDFEELRHLWQDLFDLELEAQAVNSEWLLGKADVGRSGSSWTPQQLATYLEVFRVIPWADGPKLANEILSQRQEAPPCKPKPVLSDGAEGPWVHRSWCRVDMLDEFLAHSHESPFARPNPSERFGPGAPAPLDDAAWVATYLAGLEAMLVGLGVPKLAPEAAVSSSARRKRPPPKERGLEQVPPGSRDVSVEEAKELLKLRGMPLRHSLEQLLRDISPGAWLLFPSSLQKEERHILRKASGIRYSAKAGAAALPIGNSKVVNGDSERLVAWLGEANLGGAVVPEELSASPREVRALSEGIRLAGLAGHQGREAASRAAINAILLPLIAKLGLEASLE